MDERATVKLNERARWRERHHLKHIEVPWHTPTLNNAVMLSNDEMLWGEQIGKARLRAGRHDNVSLGENKRSPEERMIDGTRCEYAASRMLNLYWRPAIGRYDDPDVGGLVEVRSAYVPGDRLIVKPTDKNLPFCLIHNAENVFTFWGWCYASFAKQFKLDHFPNTDAAHYVPRDFLEKFEDLAILIHSGVVNEITRPYAANHGNAHNSHQA